MFKFLKVFAIMLLLTGCPDQKKEEKIANIEGSYNLVVSTQYGDIKYMVENAVTPQELSRGLMFRDSLDANSGMMFDLIAIPTPSMWMKNTKIPLDMVFTDGNGNIVWIFENAEPMSEEQITPPVPVKSVIEFNAGDVKKYDMRVGDVVKHEFFNTLGKIVTVNGETIEYEEETLAAESVHFDEGTDEGETEVDESIIDDGNEETIVKE